MGILALAFTFLFETGINYFLGDVQKEIGVSPYIGTSVETELSYYTNGYLTGSYSYLFLKNNTDFHGLHQFIGRAGIESPEHLFKAASIGAGVSLAGIRGNAASSEAENYMLASSESDFGWNIRLKLNLLEFEKISMGTIFYFDNIWTKPENSKLLHGGIFVKF